MYMCKLGNSYSARYTPTCPEHDMWPEALESILLKKNYYGFFLFVNNRDASYMDAGSIRKGIKQAYF